MTGKLEHKILLLVREQGKRLRLVEREGSKIQTGKRFKFLRRVKDLNLCREVEIPW